MAQTNRRRQPQTGKVVKRCPGWMRNLVRRVRRQIEECGKAVLLIRGRVEVVLQCEAHKVADAIRALSVRHSTKAIDLKPLPVW